MIKAKPATVGAVRVSNKSKLHWAAALNRHKKDRTGTYQEQAGIQRSPHKEGEG